MKKRFVIYLPILFAIILVSGIYLGYKISPLSNYPQVFSLNLNKYNKLNDVVNYIVEEYVDTVDKKKLEKEGINGMLNMLDPHSQYITAEEFDAVNDPLIGNFEGIGIQFRIEKDSIVVIQTIAGGPSEKVGLQAGDRIVRVNDSLVAGIGIDNTGAMKQLKGKRGTKVNVNIYRRGLASLLDFEITRDVIPTFSVDFYYMPAEAIGYMKVSKFSATTYKEFKEAARDLLNQGMKNLILDLRGNTGGYLQAAIDISDEFLVKDKLVVYTKGQNQPKESFYATTKGSLENTNLIILIDDNTASASEIVAGAIQDNDRAIIIGRRSFGKGLVQRQLDLLDGSALRLTIARYYTPTGRCIQKPYKPGDGFDEYYSESYHRYTNGEMEVKDSMPVVDSLKYITPEGKIVYGGGGISPDIFVPINNSPDLIYYFSLINKGLIFRYAFEYTDSHRTELNEFKDFEDFNKHFQITSVLLSSFNEYAANHGVSNTPDEIRLSETMIKALLKAYIARNIFDNEGFYPIYLSIDEVFIKALKVFN
ncbi:MAG: S41 family peptidase [Bacteroidales bacterium]|nr:S41 family peptidase [Bacteroidales bacterium]MCF8403704.1 S41 family peptidase [Bacteroidales bacterium]